MTWMDLHFIKKKNICEIDITFSRTAMIMKTTILLTAISILVLRFTGLFEFL